MSVYRYNLKSPQGLSFSRDQKAHGVFPLERQARRMPAAYDIEFKQNKVLSIPHPSTCSSSLAEKQIDPRTTRLHFAYKQDEDVRWWENFWKEGLHAPPRYLSCRTRSSPSPSSGQSDAELKSARLQCCCYMPLREERDAAAHVRSFPAWASSSSLSTKFACWLIPVSRACALLPRVAQRCGLIKHARAQPNFAHLRRGNLTFLAFTVVKPVGWPLLQFNPLPSGSSRSSGRAEHPVFAIFSSGK